MQPIDLESFTNGKWVRPDQGLREIPSAVTGQVVARATVAAPDPDAMLVHARQVGGPAIRALGFHERARVLKALAQHLMAHKESLYALSTHTGATRADSWIDIEGGIGTLFVYAAKGRRELPDGDVYIDGALEPLGQTGAFAGQHVCVSLQGAAVQINAFNFPVWGLLEKFAPAFLAGLPTIVKPATQTAYLAEACVRLMTESDLLPEGALQMAIGGIGGLLDRLGAQDVLSFTGSAATASVIRGQISGQSVRFTAEQDSLNASILGPDAGPDTPEFALFVKEAAREMRVKAGQKCTATRRLIVPAAWQGAAIEALSAQLAKTVIGDPALERVTMGPLVSQAQRADVLAVAERLSAEAKLAYGGTDLSAVEGADAAAGAFVGPMLFHCADPDGAERVHREEAFGPISTVMGYRDIDHGVALANRGGGALVVSLFTHDPALARHAVMAAAPWHGRIYLNDRDAAAEATGHGSPMPHMTHGGPGRAGGGEELGGIRAVLHHMQRTAVQASPRILSALTGRLVPGAPTHQAPSHPFTRGFHALQIGETITTQARTVKLEDIEHFAQFTGDTFYAHMDDAAAKANPFFPGRVAHGYLLLSFAAGLFVQPDPGPVLANTGLENLRFMAPVSPGEAIHVRLSVMAKTRRTAEYGEVRWSVTLLNQDDVSVAAYELLTMNAYEAA